MSTAIVFDFDDTLTVKKAESAREYNYDYQKSIFGSDERILMVVRFLRKFKADGAGLYICSGNDENLIIAIIEALHAEGFDIKGSQFNEIVGNENDKASFVNSLRLRYDRVIFIDNNRDNYLGVTTETLRIARSGGMTLEDFQRIIIVNNDPQNFFTPKKARVSTKSENEVW
jgi:hypothetical protein